jgi:hypothetical protein
MDIDQKSLSTNQSKIKGVWELPDILASNFFFLFLSGLVVDVSRCANKILHGKG